MKLGVFSLSLNVKNIHESRQFYEQLEFVEFGGNIEQNWLIMKNGEQLLGLFQGMFDKNMLTFNPGWDADAKNVDPFTDVRELQRSLRQKGMQFVTQADESTVGPASFMVIDPDGNPVLFDQHR